MKTLLIVTMLALTAFAGTPNPLEKASPNYLRALKSDNSALVESALFQVLQLKRQHPDHNVETLVAQTAMLMNSGETGLIRYKAYLANFFLEHPDLLASVEPRGIEEQEQFFASLAARLQAHLFASN